MRQRLQEFKIKKNTIKKTGYIINLKSSHRWFFYAALVFALSFVLNISSFAQIEAVIPNPPQPPRLVNDFSDKSNGQTGFLSSGEIQSLENKLVAYDDTTSNQIAVVVVDDLGGDSIDEYAVALGRKWGVGGQKQFSNGVVLLVNTAKKGGQRGVFIATGYGLEGAVTDLVASEIVQNNLLPNFRAGNNYQGINEAVDNIIAAASGRYTAPEGYHQRGGEGGMSIFTIIILVVVIFIVLSIISRKGGGGGGYVSRRGYTDDWGGRRGGLPWIIGGGSGWGSGGGGGWSSGGGGGFGGFGGGSFGGGGAGGSW